jgi:hypothetical protein
MFLKKGGSANIILVNTEASSIAPTEKHHCITLMV